MPILLFGDNTVRSSGAPVGGDDVSSGYGIVGTPGVPTGLVIYGTSPSSAIIAEFEADVIRVERWVDIYESDAETLWQSRVRLRDGAISVDMTRSERRNIDLTLYDAGDLGYGPGELWYDKIIKPYRGILLSTGDVWVTPLGSFMIDGFSRPHFPAEIKVTGRDFTKKLLLAKFPQVTTFNSGENVCDVIKTIATNGGISRFDLISSTEVLGSAITFEGDTTRWDAIAQLAQSIGCEVFFDRLNNMVVRPFVDPLTAPTSHTFATGRSGNVSKFTRVTNDAIMFNHVVVVGNGRSNTLVCGQAENNNPTSPTSISEIGRRTYTIQNAFVASNAMADQIAGSYLSVMGLEQYDISIDSLTAPWLEAGEAVRFDDSSGYGPTRFLLSSFTIPLALAPMSATIKRITIAG